MRLLLCIAYLLLTFAAKAVMVTVRVGDNGNTFFPTYFTINPGDTVKWVWISGFHNTSATSVPTGATAWYANMVMSGDTYIYVPTVSGLYNFTCTHHSAMDGQFFVTGCSFPAKPVVSSANGTAACKGGSIMLNIPAQTGVTYQWINGAVTIPGANSPAYTATASGAYKVIVNRCGVDSVSNAFNITIESPKPSFTHTYSGLTFSFTNTTNPIAGHNFVWSFGDGSPDVTTVNPTHTFPSPGAYTVTLRATDATMLCTDTTQQLVQIPLGIANAPVKTYAIFPNPASASVYIQTTDKAVLSITDCTGRSIPVPVYTNDKGYTIDVANLVQGLYYLSISTQNSFSTEKIIVRR